MLRSVHRYAADAFVVVTVLHLLREAWLGRWRFPRLQLDLRHPARLAALRWASSATGWSGTRARSSRFSRPWNGWASPRVGEAPDRLFSLFVFLHIGLPLALLAGRVHVQRLGRPRLCRRAPHVGLCSNAFRYCGASGRPSRNGTRARRREMSAVDWFYQFIHPLMYATSPDFLWAVALGATALLLLMPYVSRKRHLVVAKVDPANCTDACGVSRTALTTPSRSEKAVGFPSAAPPGILCRRLPLLHAFSQHRATRLGIEPDQTMQGLRRRSRRHCRVPRWFCCEKARSPARSPAALPRHATALGGRARARRGARRKGRRLRGDCAYRSAWSGAKRASPAGANPSARHASARRKPIISFVLR